MVFWEEGESACDFKSPGVGSKGSQEAGSSCLPVMSSGSPSVAVLCKQPPHREIPACREVWKTAPLQSSPGTGWLEFPDNWRLWDCGTCWQWSPAELPALGFDQAVRADVWRMAGLRVVAMCPLPSSTPPGGHNSSPQDEKLTKSGHGDISSRQKISFGKHFHYKAFISGSDPYFF